MLYNFKEAILGKDFAKDKLKEFKQLIDSGISFVVTSMPGVGAAYFLRYLALQDFAKFFHIDLYSLPSLTQSEFYKLLLTELGGKPISKTDEQLLIESKKILQSLTKNHNKIVLIFNHFDQLAKDFDSNFLSNIQSLATQSFATVSPGKIVLIFTSIKPLNEISTEAFEGGNLNFFSEIVYFKPYSKSDLEKLISIEPPRSMPKDALDKLIVLSGGHNQLLQILRRSQKQQNLLLDQFVKLQLKGLVDYLDYTQKKQLQKMASKASHPVLDQTYLSITGSIDDYLLGVGMIRKVGSRFELFTPLLSEYIKQNMSESRGVNSSNLEPTFLIIPTPSK